MSTRKKPVLAPMTDTTPLVIPMNEKGEAIIRALDAIDRRLEREAQSEHAA